jgi:hypothetical protein
MKKGWSPFSINEPVRLLGPKSARTKTRRNQSGPSHCPNPRPGIVSSDVDLAQQSNFGQDGQGWWDESLIITSRSFHDLRFTEFLPFCSRMGKLWRSSLPKLTLNRLNHRESSKPSTAKQQSRVWDTSPVSRSQSFTSTAWQCWQCWNMVIICHNMS